MLYTAIILGLVSSLHCIAMCGPIAVMLPFAHNNPKKKVAQLLTYHCGRIASYTLIGLLFGAFGRALYVAGLQQQLSVFAGILIIAITVLPQKAFAKFNLSGPLFKAVSAIRTALGSQFKKQSFAAIFSIGLMNGLLPCGMVYAALFGALATQNILTGSIYMMLFGLGTVPLMSSLVYMQQWATLGFRNKAQKIIPYAMTLIGLLFVLRGLGLDIAYISPAQTALFVKAVADCN